VATRPENIAEWATNLVLESIGPNNFINRVEPSQGFKDSGVLALEPWNRPFLNYQLYMASQWFKYIDEALYPIASVYQETANVNPATTLDYGTWVLLGNQVIGVTTTYYWERTA
jgi:hypothetical protein